MKLKKEMKDKIEELVWHNNEIIGLMNDITAMDKKLDKPVEALDEGWEWEMYFRGTPKEITVKEIEAVILTALTGKVHKVDYGLKYTSINEIK